MPLTRQVVPVMLKGLDQLAPRQAGIMSGLNDLLNMYAQAGDANGYEFVPRPGTTAINRPGGTGGTAGTRLAVLNGQLLMFSDTALWRRAIDGWHSIAGPGSAINDTVVSVASQRTTPMFTEGIAATSCDVAYVLGYTINATTAGFDATLASTSLNITVTDSNGAALDAPNLTGAGAPVSSFRTFVQFPTAARIAVVANVAVIFWAETGGSNTIKCIKFDPGTVSFGAITTVTTTANVAAYNPVYDIQAIPGTQRIAILWNNSAANTLSQVLLAPSTMTLGGVTTYAGKGTNFSTKGYLATDFSTPVLYVAYISSATGLHLDQFDSATLAAGTATIADGSQTAGDSITGSRTAGQTFIYFTVKGTRACDDQIRVSIGVTAVVLSYKGRAIASRATLASNATSSAPLFLTKYRGTGQVTYFLNCVDSTFISGRLLDLARSMSDIGAPDPTNSMVGLLSLPNLMNGSTASTWLTAGLRSSSLDSGPTGITAITGGASISVVIGDQAVGRAVELNGNLHIPGALPMLYDGFSLTEEGFPIAPEQSDAYVMAAGGAMTASSIYTYRYVFEWTDGAGNLHRSPPNLVPQQAVLAAGQTQVTHSIPSLYFGMKNPIYLAVYRTLANGDGSVYFKVGSINFSPGSGGRLSFIDRVADTIAATGIPLYTDGNILENLAPPPCVTMAIHRGRILVGGVDGDPTAVWFSKDVVQGFGVAFNDGLVSRLNSANESVTALGSMDTYAAAFTATTMWASTTDYPDDTGAGGVLKFEQYSSTNGCLGARLVARADDGLTCWQRKATSGTTQGVENMTGPGPWRLSRGLTWEWIAQGIQLDAAALTPRAIVAVPGLNQIRIVGQGPTSTGTVLTRETIFGTWATWTYLVSPSGAPTIVDAIVWGNQVAYLGADGHVLLENNAIYSDTSTVIAHSLTLSAFNFAGVAAYQRIYVGQLTGRILGDSGGSFPQTLSIVQTIDGTAMAAKTRTLSPDTDGLFAGVEFDPGPNGKCSAYQVTISNAAGGGNDFRSGWTLAAVTMEVGVKPSVNRLPPAKRAI